MSETPLGWNYNPAGWRQRLPRLGLALAGLGLVVYCALGQPALVPSVWGFFFPEAWWNWVVASPPFLRTPETLAMAVGYFLLLLGTLAGGAERWRKYPGLVLTCGWLAAGLAVFSILEAILTSIVFELWYSPWVISAFLSVLLVAAGTDEILASLQHLKRSRRGVRWLWGLPSIPQSDQ